ncbi:hypothetical protein JCM11641_001429 [Rhodosporidiobolus odoratus]
MPSADASHVKLTSVLGAALQYQEELLAVAPELRGIGLGAHDWLCVTGPYAVVAIIVQYRQEGKLNANHFPSIFRSLFPSSEAVPELIFPDTLNPEKNARLVHAILSVVLTVRDQLGEPCNHTLREILAPMRPGISCVRPGPHLDRRSTANFYVTVKECRPQFLRSTGIENLPLFYLSGAQEPFPVTKPAHTLVWLVAGYIAASLECKRDLEPEENPAWPTACFYLLSIKELYRAAELLDTDDLEADLDLEKIHEATYAHHELKEHERHFGHNKIYEAFSPEFVDRIARWEGRHTTSMFTTDLMQHYKHAYPYPEHLIPVPAPSADPLVLTSAAPTSSTTPHRASLQHHLRQLPPLVTASSLAKLAGLTSSRRRRGRY